MLNMPQRNANATARPVRIRVVVCSSVCERLYDALLTVLVVGWKIQLSPAPLKMSRYASSGLWPGGSTITPPSANATNAGRTRTAVPPARCPQLVLVAAGRRAGRRQRAPAADIEFLDQDSRTLDKAFREQPPPLRVGRLGVVV